MSEKLMKELRDLSYKAPEQLTAVGWWKVYKKCYAALIKLTQEGEDETGEE